MGDHDSYSDKSKNERNQTSALDGTGRTLHSAAGFI
jgi:hypothetical protein